MLEAGIHPGCHLLVLGNKSNFGTVQNLKGLFQQNCNLPGLSSIHSNLMFCVRNEIVFEDTFVKGFFTFLTRPPNQAEISKDFLVRENV